jgi:hypothetical protein
MRQKIVGWQWCDQKHGSGVVEVKCVAVWCKSIDKASQNFSLTGY